MIIFDCHLHSSPELCFDLSLRTILNPEKKSKSDEQYTILGTIYKNNNNGNNKINNLTPPLQKLN